MNSILSYIQEKLIINKKVKPIGFSDEELRKDYESVKWTITKAEKMPFMEKYGVSDNKIKVIQLAILDKLRENRQKKKQFDEKDILDFHRYDMPEKQYIEYLKKEPKEFAEVLFKKYESLLHKWFAKYGPHTIPNRYNSTSTERYRIKRYKEIKKYLKE